MGCGLSVDRDASLVDELRSASRMRPPGPVPMIVPRSIPASSARLLMAGDAFGRAGFMDDAGSAPALTTVDAVALTDVAGTALSIWRSAGGEAESVLSIVTSTCPTWAMSPSAKPRPVMVPATGDGSCVWLLSVRISTRGWSRRTASPTATSHSTISASSSPSPTSGSLNSVVVTRPPPSVRQPRRVPRLVCSRPRAFRRDRARHTPTLAQSGPPTNRTPHR